MLFGGKYSYDILVATLHQQDYFETTRGKSLPLCSLHGPVSLPRKSRILVPWHMSDPRCNCNLTLSRASSPGNHRVTTSGSHTAYRWERVWPAFQGLDNADLAVDGRGTTARLTTSCYRCRHLTIIPEAQQAMDSS